MKAVLISSSASQLESLQHTVEAEGYVLTKAIHRGADTALSNLIENLSSEVLIVDCTGTDQAQDIATLEVLIAANPHVVVLLLTQTRDADTLLAAMQAGVREVLLSPPSAADLTAALRRFALRKKTYPQLLQ